MSVFATNHISPEKRYFKILFNVKDMLTDKALCLKIYAFKIKIMYFDHEQVSVKLRSDLTLTVSIYSPMLTEDWLIAGVAGERAGRVCNTSVRRADGYEQQVLRHGQDGDVPPRLPQPGRPAAPDTLWQPFSVPGRFRVVLRD